MAKNEKGSLIKTIRLSNPDSSQKANLSLVKDKRLLDSLQNNFSKEDLHLITNGDLHLG